MDNKDIMEATSEVKTVPQVDQYLEQLSDMALRLRKQSTDLNTKFSPVLSEPYPTESNETDTFQETLVPLANELKNVVGVLEMVFMENRSIIDRAEV